MNKKLKLALVALLGFSTACSSVKKAATADKKQNNEEQQVDSTKIYPPRPIRVVMYGVRPPFKMGNQELESPKMEAQKDKSDNKSTSKE